MYLYFLFFFFFFFFFSLFLFLFLNYPLFLLFFRFSSLENSLYSSNVFTPCSIAFL